MRISLVGSDCEENLGLAMVAAALSQAKHRPEIVAYNSLSEIDEIAKLIVKQRPQMVGLGIQFQHRAYDFLHLAKELRTLGYSGHITCGGQYPSMAWAEILEHEPAIDSIILHEAEQSIVELSSALLGRQDIKKFPGSPCAVKAEPPNARLRGASVLISISCRLRAAIVNRQGIWVLLSDPFGGAAVAGVLALFVQLLRITGRLASMLGVVRFDCVRPRASHQKWRRSGIARAAQRSSVFTMIRYCYRAHPTHWSASPSCAVCSTISA